jgi:hypothetical protein
MTEEDRKRSVQTCDFHLVAAIDEARWLGLDEEGLIAELRYWWQDAE